MSESLRRLRSSCWVKKNIFLKIFKIFIHFFFSRTGRAGNKGYSYTFILPTGQERSAGDVCRAFELANQKIPEDLKKLWTDYVEQMKSEGKEIKLGGGFGGHGFKFDANEAEAKQNKRNMEKMLHGLQEGDEEDEEDVRSQKNLFFLNFFN